MHSRLLHDLQHRGIQLKIEFGMEDVNNEEKSGDDRRSEGSPRALDYVSHRFRNGVMCGAVYVCACVCVCV